MLGAVMNGGYVTLGPISKILVEKIQNYEWTFRSDLAELAQISESPLGNDLLAHSWILTRIIVVADGPDHTKLRNTSNYKSKKGIELKQTDA